MWNSTNTRGIQKLLFHRCAAVLCQALTHLVCLFACLLVCLKCFLSCQSSPGEVQGHVWRAAGPSGLQRQTMERPGERLRQEPAEQPGVLWAAGELWQVCIRHRIRVTVCHSGRLALIKTVYRQSVTRMGPNTTETDTISASSYLMCIITGLFSF